MSCDAVFLLVPSEVFGIRPESGVFMEVERLAVAGSEALAVGRGFGEEPRGDVDQEVVALGDGGPQPGVEHPVGVGGEGEAVAGIVVAAHGVLVDVGGLDDGACGGLEAVAGEGR
jgi:hypothetical protein